jgi:ribonuclease R
MTFKKRRGAPLKSKKAEPQPIQSVKSTKIARNLAKTVLQYVQGKRYTPATASQLIEMLAIPEVHHPLFKKILADLSKNNELSCQNDRYSLPSNAKLATGPISVHPKGFGFVRQQEGPDVFIPKHSLGDAVDGDTVEVEVNPVVSAKGPEGIVIAILKRSRTHLAGTVLRKSGNHFIAYAPLLGLDKPIIVKAKKTPLKEGDRIICKVTEWRNSDDLVEGEVSRLIGHISDPSIDVQAAIEEFELPDGFSREALEEAGNYGTKVTAKDMKGRTDLTDWESVTIDPDTARDYDDAISLSRVEQGHYLLGVHIADVAYYVRPGMHLDKEALLRCNSTYFPGQCVPMLPEELSNELCSLKPKVKRLTQSVLAEFDAKGNLVDYQIHRSCIKSQKRFTYKEAYQVLQGKKKSPHAPLLNLMVELCNLFKQKRMERGSIDFAMPDDVVIVNDKGEPVKIERVEYDITHQMIEEFMLKANELVAIDLAKQGKSLIYRVHEQPTAESFKDFYAFARSLGFTLPAEPTHKDIQKLFQDAKTSPLLPQLSVSFIRSMRLACYSPDNIGHYGLALEHYCHFTSPIRRYTDLVIQRLLFDPHPASTDVGEIATACSEKERISFRAESSVVLLKKLRLASTYFAEDPTQIYPAIVTRVKPFALFFEVPAFDLEGTVHISKLGNDYFEFNPARMAFRGKRTGKTFSAGETIYVRLDKIDYILQQSEWAIVSPPEIKPKK